jgi:hypothetical protein
MARKLGAFYRDLPARKNFKIRLCLKLHTFASPTYPPATKACKRVQFLIPYKMTDVHNKQTRSFNMSKIKGNSNKSYSIKRKKKKMERRSLIYVIIAFLVCVHGRCNSQQTGGDGKLYVVGKYNIGMAYDFDIKNDYAYLGTNEGLLILDISKRDNPVKLSELKLGFIREVKVVDASAYLSGGANGFFIVDVSNAKQPKVLGEYRNGGEIYGSAKSGSYAYLCDRLKGIKVIDMEDPGGIKEIKQWSNGGQYWEIGIKDQIAFVADAINGLEIFDISDPTSPSLITIVPDTKGATSIMFNNDQLALGTLHGIKVYDIKNPKVPQLTISTFNDKEVSSADILNKIVFAGVDGVIGFKISEQKEIIQLGKWTIKGGVHGVIYDGHYIYTAKKGFYVLKLKD